MTKQTISEQIIRFYNYREGLKHQLTLLTTNRGKIEALRDEYDRVGKYMLYLSALKSAVVK